MSRWWTYPGKQEGCHFEVKPKTMYCCNFEDIWGLKMLSSRRLMKKLTFDRLSTLTSMSENPDVMATFGKVNTHGYDGLNPYCGKDRESLKSLATKSGKTLWDSDDGEKDGTGLSMAQSIALDINQMGVLAFVPYSVYPSRQDTKYYALAQYSRHIRPGMAILSTDYVNTVMVYDATSKLLVLATLNTGNAASKVTYDLASFKSVAGPISAWMTETSGTGALYKVSKVQLKASFFSASIPAASVMTFEIEIVAV